MYKINFFTCFPEIKDTTPPELSLEFRVFLVNKENGKHTQESRTLRFWFRGSSVSQDDIDGLQAGTAQDFFRELVSPQEFPRGNKFIFIIPTKITNSYYI